jgi:hypothetical protein
VALWLKLRGALRSSTVQFNSIAAIVLYLLAEAGKLDAIADDPQYAAILAGVIALVNVVLRFKTSQPLEER